MRGRHESDHHHAPSDRSAQKSATARVLAINSVFFVIVALFGFLSHALVLLASAVHLLADLASLGIGYFAIILASKPASEKHSFGLVRAEVLGATVNGTILLATSIWIIFQAIHDLASPHFASPTPIVVLGAIGLIVSLISLTTLHKHAGKSLNMRAGVIHMAGDAAGWLITIASGLLILLFKIQIADSIGSIAISILILLSSWQILVTTLSVLLESTPRSIDPQEIMNSIEKDPTVIEVHHLHLWNLASDTTALSSHVVMEDGSTLHLAQLKVQQIKQMLKDEYGIDHVTIEIECHKCGDAEHSLDI